MGTSLAGFDLDAASARFDSKWTPEPNTGCWLWFGAVNKRGYGAFAVVSRQPIVVVSAHRYSYWRDRGPIPDGLTLDHLCRQPGCVNPAHLEPVTIEENTRRANACRVLISACVRGHQMSGANLYLDPNGRRSCRACRSAWARRARTARTTSAPRGVPLTPTPRNLVVLRAIARRTAANGFPPSIRELCTTLRVRSTQGVVEHLEKLEALGLVTRRERSARSLVLTPSGRSALGVAS